ncbi:solute carrier family 22 member 16-like [Tribolium madens]|uniref:solute carrier family 22 member 16-like n=1 Tax=Tribolium madens TaxID=41895 RepID=UPI001CF74FE3|nr:solute carrier family 22 member 16-like [Tribolium madens]
MRHVLFSSEPSEKEFFEEYDKYNAVSLWFILIFLLRSLVPLCFALQTGIFEFSDSIDLYFEYFSISHNSTEHFIFQSLCLITKKKNETEHECVREDCNQMDIALKMSLLKSIGFSLGAIFGGVLSDIFGRRIVCLSFSVIWYLSSLVIALANDKLVVDIFYTITTASANIVNVVTFVTFGEIANRKSKLLAVYSLMTLILGSFMSISFSKIFTVWKYFSTFISSINVLIIFGCWYIPESPRWLLNKNKQKEVYKQLNDISGLIYTVQITASEGNTKKTKEFYRMFLYLFKSKLKYFLLISWSMIISSFLYNCSKMKALINFVNRGDYGVLGNVAEIMGFLFLFPIYIFLGKRFGLLFLYVLVAVQALFAMFLATNERIYHVAFGILFGTSTVCLNWLYCLDLFPTFLRGTVMGFNFCLFGLTMFVSAFLAKMDLTAEEDEKKLNNVYYYVIYLCGGIFGLSVFLLPETANQDLPNFKLYE